MVLLLVIRYLLFSCLQAYGVYLELINLRKALARLKTDTVSIVTLSLNCLFYVVRVTLKGLGNLVLLWHSLDFSLTLFFSVNFLPFCFTWEAIFKASCVLCFGPLLLDLKQKQNNMQQNQTQ